MNIVIVCLASSSYDEIIGDVEQLDGGDYYIKNPYNLFSYTTRTESENFNSERESDFFDIINDIKEIGNLIYHTETRFEKFMPESIDEGFIVPSDKVFTMAEPKTKIKEKYQQLINL